MILIIFIGVVILSVVLMRFLKRKLNIVDIASNNNEPLGYRTNGCYKNDFINTIYNLAIKIRDCNEENQIDSLIKTMGNSIEDDINNEREKDKKDLYKTVPELLPSVAFAGFPLRLHPVYRNAELKINKIDRILALFVLFIISKVDKQQKNASRSLFKSKKEYYFEKKISYLMNVEVLSITKAKDIKNAWLAIIKDKTLTLNDLNKLLNKINKVLMIFPGRIL